MRFSVPDLRASVPAHGKLTDCSALPRTEGGWWVARPKEQRSLVPRNWGRIIFISSESGLVTPGEMLHYGMTKTAQLAVSRGLAGLTKGTKVTVNSVLPGPTRSESIIDFLKSLASDPTAPPEQIEAEFFAKGRPSSLLQRMIEPGEIANLVAYVASPLSSATNGAALRVDGGVTPTIG
jgi:NAD(P)-dependent dehydrogenase (short-subunit alcohol dehydrogenase family)